MLRFLQISIIFLFASICTTAAQTKEPPLFPNCIGEICFCSRNTHEAVYNGIKYCAPDGKESCPDHAVRLSQEVCECRKGYRYLSNKRTKCVPERTKQPVPTTPITDKTTITTTTPATVITTTSIEPNTTRSKEPGSNIFYIYIGILVIAITALSLIVFLYIERKQYC